MGLALVLSLFGPADTGDGHSLRIFITAYWVATTTHQSRHDRTVLAISDVELALTFHFSSSISLTKYRFSS